MCEQFILHQVRQNCDARKNSRIWCGTRELASFEIFYTFINFFFFLFLMQPSKIIPEKAHNLAKILLLFNYISQIKFRKLQVDFFLLIAEKNTDSAILFLFFCFLYRQKRGRFELLRISLGACIVSSTP